MRRPTLDRPASSASACDSVRSPWRRLVLVGLTALSAYSTGIGWQAQAVSYPLYRAVAEGDFLRYHQQYDEAIPLVVVVPGFVTFLASAAFPWLRPASVPRVPALLVATSGVVSLLTTVLWAIPRHDRLDRIGRSAETIDGLLRANLVRSVSLTVGTVALCWCVTRLLGASRA